MKLLINRLSDKSPYSKDYHLLAIASTLLMACILLIFIFYLSASHKTENVNLLKKEANNIHDIIFHSFDYSNRINSYIGQQIADHGAQDLEFIAKLFREIDKMYLFREFNRMENKNSDLISWTSFDWVNAKNFQTVNSRLGIQKNPPDMSNRKYAKSARQNPWTLQVSFPALGIPSGMWVIPAGTGITDKENNFLGTVVVGFRIDEIENKIQRKLMNQNIEYVVLDNSSNIVLQSSGNNLQRKDEFFKSNNINQKFKQNSGTLKEPLIVNNINYYYYQKMDNYPYIILTGFSESFLNKKFYDISLPRILEFSAITAFFLLILYLFKTRALALLRNEQSLTERLNEANLHLKTVNRSVNHDLRNYISGILGISHIIEEESKIDEKVDFENQKLQLNSVHKHSKMISNQAELMLKFSESLVKEEKFEEELKKIKVLSDEENLKTIDVKDLINDLLFLQKPFFNKQEVSIKINIEENLPSLYINVIELRKILDNLITNAAKYSPKNSVITINVHKHNPAASNFSIYVEIIDQGIGMTQDEITKALDGKGKSIDKSGFEKEIKSHGLGLPIVKKAVQNLDAKMQVESEKGYGTKIKLWFKNQNLEAKNKAEKKELEICASYFNSKTILLADDEDLILISVKYQLKKLGFNVLTAKTRKEIIDILENNHCDVILLDSNMEGVNDGIETAKIIREGVVFEKFKNFKEITIISLSSYSDKKSKDFAFKNGVNEYLEKPFNKNNFMQILNEK